MSYPKGDHPAQPKGSGASQRPSFDRPSLFAGMEDDDASEDTRRVRILSTLESTRQASKPGRTRGGRRTKKTKRSGWAQGALWGVLGVGVLALLAGFVMVIQDSKPALAHTAPLPATHVAKAAQQDSDLSKAGSLPPAAAGPAVIETPDVSGAPVAAPVAPQSIPAPTASAALPAMAPAPKLDTTLASSQAGITARADEATPGAAPTAPTTGAKSASKPVPNGAAKGQDEDVALLEAMFAHTGRKTATPKPASPKN